MILHLIPHFGIGGDLVIVKAMVSVQKGAGTEVMVNGMEPETAFGDSKVCNPFPLNKGQKGFLKAWNNRNLIRTDVRVLHAHSPICLLFARLLQITCCRTAAVVFTFHWPVPDHGLRRALKGLLFRSADRVHVYSAETEETVRTRYRISDDKLRLLHVGVPKDRFIRDDPYQTRRNLRNRFGIDADSKVIGYLGRLATEKNVSFLIRFMEENNNRYQNLRLVIAGTGALEREVREQAANGSAAERIQFLGYTGEPEAVYPGYDLLVLPSAFEAFALVVVEAAYCGVPTLRSDVDGSRDQITEGVTGFVYPQIEGYPAMATALIRILENDWERLPEIGAAARDHCLVLCDMERFTRGLANLYSDLRL